MTLCGPPTLPGAGGCILSSFSWCSGRPCLHPRAAGESQLCRRRGWPGREPELPGRAQGRPPGSHEKQPRGLGRAQCSRVRLQKSQPARGPSHNPEQLGASHSPALQHLPIVKPERRGVPLTTPTRPPAPDSEKNLPPSPARGNGQGSSGPTAQWWSPVGGSGWGGGQPPASRMGERWGPAWAAQTLPCRATMLKTGHAA